MRLQILLSLTYLTGIAGIAAVKNLTEVGFDVTGFDAADAIGGLWHYSEEQRTTCLYSEK